MKSSPQHRSTATGLTLLEMLICLAILALTTAVALPQATHALAQQRIRQHMLLLHAQLAMARSTAITKSAPVSLCASRDGALCQLDGDWSSGRLMYLDRGKTAHPKYRRTYFWQQRPTYCPPGQPSRPATTADASAFSLMAAAQAAMPRSTSATRANCRERS